MSYFNFDLQLFSSAPVTVDLTGVSELTATSTRFYVKSSGDPAVYSWKDAKGETDTIVATLAAGKLTIIAADEAEVTLSGVTEAALKENNITVATVASTAEDASATECTVSLAGSEGSIKATTLTFTTNGIVADADKVAVSAAGVVSALQAGGTFTVYTDMSDTLGTTYKVGAAPAEDAEDKTTTLSVSGDTVGAYKGVVLTGNDGASTITLGANGAVTVTPSTVGKITEYIPNNATLILDSTEVQTETVVNYFAITLNDGKLEVADTGASTATGGLGYYKVTYNPNNGLNANVKVELVAADDQAAKLLGDVPVTIDATKVAQINKAEVTAITVATGITTGTVQVNGVPTTADVTVDKEYSADTATSSTQKVGIDYVKTFAVATANNAANINLASLTADSVTNGDYYFVIDTAADTTNGHGKMLCTVNQASVAENAVGGKAAFKVTKSNEGFAVTFVPATDSAKGPQNLNATGWQNITINANGATKAITITTQVGDTADASNDNYTVNNAAIGVKVTKATVADGKKDNSELTVNRVAGDVATTIVYNDGNGETEDDSAITLPAANGTEYWLVTKNAEKDNDGNPTITIAKQDGTTAPTGNVSYFAVTKDADGVTVTYNNGGNISLTGLKDANGDAVKVALGNTNIAAGDTLTITDTNTNGAVDYDVKDLPLGVKVVGAGTTDSIKYADGTLYDGNLKLTLGSDEGIKIYTVTAQMTTGDAPKPVVDANTGLTKLQATAYTPTQENATPANGTGYFTVTKDSSGNYTVVYTVNGGIDLGDSSKAIGSTTIDASGVANTANISLSSADENNKVGYKVTNVATGGTGEITVDGNDKTNESSVVTYAKTEYALASTGSPLTFDNIANGTKYYKVTAGTAQRGVVPYVIIPSNEVPNDASYFKLSYDAENKTAKIEFVENENGVKEKDFAQNISTPIQVIAPGLSSTEATTVVLTKDSTEVGSIEYNITNLPKSVTTVENAGTGDSYSYLKTYEFAEGGNNIALNGDTSKVYYYEVTATGGNNETHGVYTCTIKDGVAIDADKLTTIANKNYFKVELVNGQQVITYHQATGDTATTVLSLPNLEINVDPSQAGEKADIVCGASTGDDGPSLKYIVNGLSKGQKVTAGGTNTVEGKYNISYAFDGDTISLTKQDAGTTEYYSVVRSGGTDSDNGVIKYNLTKCVATTEKTAEQVAKESPAYFMVKYSSDYQVNVTYVNPTGADYDLTVTGVPQVTVDADGLSADGVKIDTINVADTTGGDYNKVNYALTNVPAGVNVVDTNKEDGTLDSGDTVSYKNIAVLAADATIKLGTAAETYYVVTAGTTNNGVTSCTVNADGTTEKPADTANYFVATKGSDGNYTITYHMANGTGYAFTDTAKNSLNINAAGVTVAPDTTTPGTSAPGTVSITVSDNALAGITKTVTNAAGGVTATGATISYNTTFAWAPGTYYVKLDALGNVDIEKDAASGATQGGSDDLYAKVDVTTVTTGEGQDKTVKYQVNVDTKAYKAGTNGAMEDSGSTIDLSQKVDITLEDSIKVFDAKNQAYKTIAGVTAGDELTDVPATTYVTTTNELKAGDEISIQLHGVSAPVVFKAGAAGELIIVGNNVSDGVILLDAENASVTESGGTPQTDDSKKTSAVKLTTAINGVKVTFTEGQISSIVGLEVGEQIVVTENSKSVTYGSQKINGTDYFVRVDANGNKTYAAVPQNAATADLMKMVFSETTSQAVGTLDTTNANAVSYLELGNVANANKTLAATTAGTAKDGYYYAKVTMGATPGTLASISVVKGNSAGLVDNTDAYTGTITVPADLVGAIAYTGTADTTPYKVAFTGVKANSTFTDMDADDTITTAELASGEFVTVNNGKYVASSTGTATQTLTFTGNACTGGTVLLSDGSDTLEAADGKTIYYTANGNTQNDGVTLVFGADKLTSITGLTKGESVTLTSVDDEGTVTVTKYTAGTTDEKGENVTRTITTRKKSGEQTVTEDTLTVPLVDGAQSNILAVTTATGLKLTSSFAWATDENKAVGYFANTNTASDTAGTRQFTVATQTTSEDIPLSKGTVVIKAESQLIDGEMQLTITPMVSDNDGNLTATNPYGDTVNVTAPNKPIIFDQSTVYKVAFTGVTAGSEITNNQEGSTITTVDLDEDASIVVNGQTITNKVDDGNDGTTKLYIANATDVRVIDGTIIVDGTMKGESAATSSVVAALADTVTYTADATAKAGEAGADGVVVTYADGKATAITGLTEGEQVVVKSGDITTTYQAAMEDPSDASKVVIWKTVTGYTGTNADKNGTTVASVAKTGTADLMAASYADLAPTVSGKGFTTKYATDTATGYFLIDADGVVNVADTAKDQTVATYQDAGKTLIKADIGATGVLTLTKMMVDSTGKAVAAATGTPVATKANITITSGEKITYDKGTGVVETVAISGIGKDSQITGVAAGDTVTTATLAENDTVTVGGTKFTAGAAGALTFDGTAVKSGTFKIGGTDNTLTALTATNTDDTTKVTTANDISYTAGTATDSAKDGVNVKITNGMVDSITGLWLGEKVSYTQTVTAKDGSQTTKVITYEAATTTVESGAQKGAVVVTKTETVNGDSTKYTQTFASDSLDVTKGTGWAVQSASTTSKFQFGDTTSDYTTTGYFAATVSTATDKTDATYGKYSATVESQAQAVELKGSTETTGYPKYYLKVTATKGTAGNVTFTEMGLVALKANGAIEPVTDKALYEVSVTAPAGADIKLAYHDFTVAITATDSNSKFSNLNADDTVTAATLTAGNYIVVNNKKYTAAAAGGLSIKGDTIVSGTVKVEGTALTANADGSTIAYTTKDGSANTDGVVAVFGAKGITSITDLEAGEIVTITAADGTVTTYERTVDATAPTKSVITKTITQDDQKTVWTTDSATTDATANIVEAVYGVSPEFSWPTATAKESVGYFAVSNPTTTPTATIVEAGKDAAPIYVNDADAEVIRAVVEKTDKGYTITSLKLLKGQNLKDVTATAYRETADADEPTKYPAQPDTVVNVAVTINAPSEEGITFALADTAIVQPATSKDTPDVDRNVVLNIVGAKNGQTYTGLDDSDTVTTTDLNGGEGITVNGLNYAAAEAGAFTVNGDGTAYNGGFKLAKGYVVKGLKNDASGTEVEVSMTNGDAMVVVVAGKVKSIYKLDDGETVTVKETDKDGIVSTVTYTGEAGEDNTINITRTTVKDGVKTIETANITDGEDVLGGSAVYTVVGTDSGVTSQFDWTQTSGSGYFQLTDADGKLLADTLSVATQTKAVNISAKDEGKIYAKVSLSADNTLSGISLYKVKADGTLEAVTALSDEQKVNVVITAPAAKLTADLVANTANITANTIQIVGAAAESVITLRKGDSLTTASLTADSKTISVDGTSYQAGGNTILKFVKDADTTGAKAVLTDGIVKLTNGQNFNAAGAKSAEASDNISVIFAEVNTGDSAVVTVVNGVVTNISGTGKVTVGDDVYTYNAATKVYDLSVTTATGETFTTAKLAKGAEITVGGVKYASGAADNAVTFKNEGGTNKLYSGVVTLLAQGNSLTITDGDAVTTDDVTVTYTTAAATNSGAPTVKVVNGTIQSITGLNAGETLTVVDNSVDKIKKTTTYTATATGVTRVVETVDSTGTEPVTTTVTDNATLLAGGDLLTASYYNGTDGDTDTKLVGQFSWSKDIVGRSIGYFAVTTDKNDNIKATVLEQTTEVVVTTPKKGEKTYLVASVSDGVLNLGSLLTIDADGKVTTTDLDKSTLTADSVITINAPTDKIYFEKPATNVKIALKNLAASSTVSGLIKGDTVTTATLAAGDKVTVGGNTYTAAAKGALTFIGEGAVTAADGKVTASTTDVSGAALLSGTVNLVAGESAKLAGGAAKTELGASDDITVTNNSTNADNVVVKVANGVVTSITGLTYGMVTVTNASGKIGSGKNAVEYSGATIVYTALGNNMYSRTIFKDGTTGTAGVYDDGDTLVDAGYLTVAKAGGEIYTGAYKQASYTPLSDLSFKAGEKATTTKAYYDLTKSYDAKATSMVTAANAATWDDTALNGTSEFLAVPGRDYLMVTATTTAAGVTTIKSADLYTAGATGALTKNTKATYYGTLTISGTQGMSTAENATYDEKYAVINYTLPKNGTFYVVATDVSYKSKFTNLGSGDMVTTAAVTDQALSSGTYNIYYGHDNRTDVRTITVKTGKNDSVTVSTDATGAPTKLTGLATKGEQVTVTQLTDKGLATFVYAVTAAGVVTRTETQADGKKTVAVTKDTVTETTDFASAAFTQNDDAWEYTTSNTFTADFDWTLQKNSTGYFKVANNAATAKVQKTTIKANDTASYVAVTVSADGVVDSIEQVRYDAETGEMKATDDKFSGKLTLTAPTASTFNFDRTKLAAEDTATVAITGIITYSTVSELKSNDTVTTAKLKKGGLVSVNGETYTVSDNGGALGFKVQDVSINGEDYAGKVTLTSGTAKLNNVGASNAAGYGFIYVGNSNLIEVAEGSSLTVTASTNAKNVSSFTIGDLDENESFTVNGYTYAKSGTNLVRKYNDAAGAEVTEIYANNGAKTVTSANLNKAANWKSVAETLVENNGAKTSNYGIVTANLALADSRFAADKKAAKIANNVDFGYDDNYKYVLDKYVNSNTKTSATKALNGYVVSSAADWQTAIGKVTMKQIFNEIANTTTYQYTYTAEDAVGQAIKVAANWIVNGSAQDDTITGAAKGTNTITAGAGNDTINLGGANETVVFNVANDGQNKVNNYASGKDELRLVDAMGNETGDYTVSLGNTKADSGNVYLYSDTDGEDGFTAGDNYVMLKGMGNGKAVTINDQHFYFGNGYTSTKGATFAYEDGAYYVGNTSQKNGLKVTTDKTKYSAKTLGDDVVIDLMAVDGEGHNYYNNINTVDASTSANRVVLSASTESGAEITLKGGTYQSTLKSGASNDTLQGGSGQDMFWFDDLSGNDTIKSYTSGKDAVYVGGNTDLKTSGYEVKASGSDVIISSGDNQVKIAGAANAAKAITVSKDGKIGGESVSYFVGKAGTKVANTFTYVDGAYYVGNSDTKDATSTAKFLDTLKVTGTVKTEPTAKTAIDLTTSNYQSIEAVDASTLKAGKNVTTTNMGVNVIASDDGTRFTGSAYADSFTCGGGKDYIVYKTNQGADTITNFGVDDVIKLNGLSKADIDSITTQINKINQTGSGKLTFSAGGSLTFDSATQLVYDNKTKTITGKANS